MARGTSGNSGDDRDREEAQKLIQLVAPIQPGRDTIKSRIRDTAELLGWSHSRVRDIWNGDARIIRAHEMDRLRAMTKRNISGLSTGNASENSDSG